MATAAFERARADRIFYTLVALAAAAAIVSGFARTYYFSHWLTPPDGAPVFTTLMEIHAAALTLWLTLAVAQPALIAIGKRALHKTLGYTSVALVPVIMVLMLVTSTVAVRAGRPITFPDPRILYIANLFAILQFGIPAGLGILWRRRAEFHKRLMLLSWVPLLSPSLARMPVLEPVGPLGLVFGPDLLILAGLIFDWRTRGRVHAVWKWGGGLMVLSQVAIFATIGSPSVLGLIDRVVMP